MKTQTQPIPDANTPDPSNPHTVGADTNAAEQHIQDNEYYAPENIDPVIDNSGRPDSSMQPLDISEKSERIGERNTTDGTGSEIENA